MIYLGFVLTSTRIGIATCAVSTLEFVTFPSCRCSTDRDLVLLQARNPETVQVLLEVCLEFDQYPRGHPFRLTRLEMPLVQQSGVSIICIS